MKMVFSDKVSGICSKCHQETLGGAFLLLDENGQVTGMLCKNCHQTQETENTKTLAISVKKLQGSFVQFILQQELYQVIAVKNILLKSDILTATEVNKYILNPNVSVTIKH